MMMAKTKAKAWSAQRDNLRTALALESVTGKPYERIFNKPRAMEHGEVTEALCLDTYEIVTGNLVERTGFLTMPSYMAGCSLDGHVNDFEGVVEAKCPESKTHLEYLRTGKIPEQYYFQCLHNMWVTGAQWVDFCSFDPDFPQDIQFLCVRLNRNEPDMTSYELALNLFLAEVKVEVEEIQKMRATRKAA